MTRKAKEMANKQFGRLTVVDRAPQNDNARNAMWNCKCICGNKIIVRGAHLRRGVIKSCGCLHGGGPRIVHGKSNTVEFYMFHGAKRRAKKQNIPFTITIDDIQIPSVCPVLGIPLISDASYENSPSLDRKVPEKGYTPSNVCVISYRANRIKSNATPQEMRSILTYMEA